MKSPGVVGSRGGVIKGVGMGGGQGVVGVEGRWIVGSRGSGVKE